MLLTAALLAQYAGALDISETSRLDARANQPLPGVPTPPPREIAIAADAYLTPIARLKLSDRRWDWAFSYAPTFAVTDIELASTAQPIVLNAGSASVAWHDRFVRLALVESASYGLEDLAYLYGTPIAGQTTVATTGQTTGATAGQGSGQTSSQSLAQSGTSPTKPLTVFPFGSSSTSATVSVRASRMVTVALAGGYSLSGSLTNNPQATIVYPEQYGPLASATVSYASSPFDAFVTTTSAQETTTPLGVCVPATIGKTCRQEVPVLLVQETARHRLSATATFSASLGASATIYQLNSESAWGILPVGELSFSDRFGARPPHELHDTLESSVVRLSADLLSTINVFTGSPSNRLQFSASLVDRVSHLVALSFTASALQTVPVPHPDPSPLTLLSGGVDLKMRMTSLITLGLGIQGLWENQQNVGVLPTAGASTNGPTTTSAEVGYISLTARLPTLRL